jgi:hypothetical protein
MTTRKRLIVAASIAALVSSVALAGIGFAEKREHRGESDCFERSSHHVRGGEHPGRHGGRHHDERLFESFDRNEDGKVTQAEVDQTRRERVTQFDADKDGKLTLQEYQALWLDAMRNRMVDRFQSLDDNGDAVVTSEEFIAPFSKVVSRRDRDDNGELTRDDMRKR